MNDLLDIHLANQIMISKIIDINTDLLKQIQKNNDVLTAAIIEIGYSRYPEEKKRKHNEPCTP